MANNNERCPQCKQDPDGDGNGLSYIKAEDAYVCSYCCQYSTPAEVAKELRTIDPYAKQLQNLPADVLERFRDDGFTLAYWHRLEGGDWVRVSQEYSVDDVRSALDDVTGAAAGRGGNVVPSVDRWHFPPTWSPVIRTGPGWACLQPRGEGDVLVVRWIRADQRHYVKRSGYWWCFQSRKACSEFLTELQRLGRYRHDIAPNKVIRSYSIVDGEQVFDKVV